MMTLPAVFRYPKIGWILLHVVVIPLVFFFGFLVCSWQFSAPALP